MIGDRLTWSQAGALLCTFYLGIFAGSFFMRRWLRRRRRGATMLKRPHHSARRNGTAAVP